MKFTAVSLLLFFSSLDSPAVEAGSRNRRKLSKKNPPEPPPKPHPPTPEPVPGIPPQALVALIEPVAEGAAFGTTQVSYNKDGSFLVSLDLNFLSGSETGMATITEGTSCDVASPSFSTTPFGEWDLTTNMYTALGDFATASAISMSAFREDTGKSMQETMGKTVHIMYGADMTPIGCGILKKETQEKVLVANMGLYPQYEGDLMPSGKVTVTYGSGGSDAFVFSYDVEGLLPGCENCGIHIHQGVSCDTPEQVMGHGWNNQKVDDLWTNAGGAFYNANDNGQAVGFFNTKNGYGYEENFHHAVVIHTEGGARVACGILM